MPKGLTNEELFDLFWQAYPSQRRIGKKTARDSFYKALRGKEQNEKTLLVEKMICVLESFSMSPDWKKDNNKYVPHPTTWLNAGRWDDALYQPPAGVFSTDEDLGF